MTSKVKLCTSLTGVFIFLSLSLALAAKADSVNPGLYAPNEMPYGQSFPKWSEKWWQWLVSIPQDRNPANDKTGQFCSLGQNDSHVWNLAGGGNGVYVRSCTIPRGMGILFQPVGTECSYVEFPKAKTEADLRTCAVEGDQPNSVGVEIDGKEIKNIERYIVQTPLFQLKFPPNNIFVNNTGTYGAVSHATVILLNPLAPGKHVIHFNQSTLPDPNNPTQIPYSYDITYNLMVK
jgi:hypothetical protein